MNTSFILDYLPARMQELGHERYRTSMRTVIIPSGATKVIPAYNRYLFFPSDQILAGSKFNIESSFGFYDTLAKHSEQVFEHTGKIRIENYSGSILELTFIEASPQKK